ncbi:MAG: hypothetical protein RL662_1526, partial [Bacteroidota bacterium]
TLVIFLLFHMSMNLVSIISIDAYQAICGFLGTNWYAVLATGGLAALFVLHIVYAVVLTLQNRNARGGSQYASATSADTSWSSRNMLVLGVAILAFLFVHLYDFWFKMMFAELFHLENIVVYPNQVGDHMVSLFASPVKVALYLIGTIALWLHLSHGIWSMCQSAGLNGKTWMPRLKCTANIVAAIVCIGFAVVPIFFFAKSILCTTCN